MSVQNKGLASLRSRSGFTLVELLVVITIIAILSVIGMTVFGGVQKSARDAKRRGDIDAIAKALEIYKGQNGKYPFPGTGDAWQDPTPGGNWQILSSSLSPTFIQSLPIDPLSTNTGACNNPIDHTDACHIYHYCTFDQGITFSLGINLETGPTNYGGSGCDAMSGGHVYIRRNQQ